MSTEKLKKVTLIGTLYQKAEIIKDLQNLGCMHVIPLSESQKKLQSRPSDYYEALGYLIECPGHRSPYADAQKADPDEIVRKSLNVKYKEKELRNTSDKLKRYIRKIKNWGYFDWPSPDQLGGYSLFFYKVPHYKKHAMAKAGGLIFQEVYSGSVHAYIVVVSKGEPDSTLIPGKRIEFKRRSLGEAEAELEYITYQLEELADERRRLTRYINFLLRNLHREEDETMYEYVMDRTLDEDAFFAIQGWVPEKKVDLVTGLKKKHDVIVHVEELEITDDPPTLFENLPAFKGGEDLVKFYQMPAYSDWDPSSIIYLSFSVFFAMILADAGYAAVLALVIFLMWSKMGGSATGKRMRGLGLLVSFVSVIYGMMIGSYFGFPPPSPILEQFKVLESTDFGLMMRVSILVGVAHLVIANAVMAWNNRKVWHSLSYVGWMAVFLGATGLWLAGTENLIAKAVAIAGAAMIVLFTSKRPLNSLKNILLRFSDGLLGMTNISKAFGDALSYMRLFALGLASASLAVMFNELADQTGQGIAGIGTFLALIILLFGHGLNFLLGIMGGVVHGLRLNLIEFFSWSIKDEGYVFEPFCLKEKEVWKT